MRLHRTLVAGLCATLSIASAFCISGRGGHLALGSAPDRLGLVTQGHLVRQTTVPRRRTEPVHELRAAADGDKTDTGGFVNPYTSFRKWQMELINSKAKNDEKYPEAYEGLMKEPGMTSAKAERLAKMAVSDPILYAIERRREANEINKTKMDYRKIDGFFPMEWIMSGDFGWGFNKKKKRLAEEAAAKLAAEKEAAEKKAKRWF